MRRVAELFIAKLYIDSFCPLNDDAKQQHYHKNENNKIKICLNHKRDFGLDGQIRFYLPTQ